MLLQTQKYNKNGINLNLPSYTCLKYYEISSKALNLWFQDLGLTDNDTFMSLESLKAFNRRHNKLNYEIYNLKDCNFLFYTQQHISKKIIILKVDKLFRKFVPANHDKVIKFSNTC